LFACRNLLRLVERLEQTEWKLPPEFFFLFPTKPTNALAMDRLVCPGSSARHMCRWQEQDLRNLRGKNTNWFLFNVFDFTYLPIVYFGINYRRFIRIGPTITWKK